MGKKDNTLTITINRSCETVFDYAIDPKNTPKWTEGAISEEQVSEWPVRLHTVYRNRDKQGKWREYVISDFVYARRITFSRQGTGIHAQYTLRPVAKDKCELEYYEWNTDGELEEPFTINIFEKLKSAIESRL